MFATLVVAGLGVVGNPTTTPTAPSGPTMPVTAPTTPAGPASSVTFVSAEAVDSAAGFLAEDVASVVARHELAIYSSPDFSAEVDTGARLARREKVRVTAVVAASTGEPRLQTDLGYISASVEDVRRPQLLGPKAKASVAIDLETGDLLWQDGADTPARIASVTKLLAVFLVRDWIADGGASWSTRVTMADKNLVKMSKSWDTGGFAFKRGATYSVRDLYTLAVVESSNAAVTALGVRVAGSNARFLTMMNTKAEAIGMDSSSFISVSGLDNKSLAKFGLRAPGTTMDEGNLSTAADVGRLTQALLAAYPDVLETAGIVETKIGGKKVATTNQMLPGGRYYDRTLGVNGLKTGYTSAAGYCLVATSAKAGRHGVLIVILGANNSRDRFSGTARLLHSIYDRWALRS
ncbi:MAG: serine hydrolase [Bifidobacteriaceae bacterium]|nr:serine hydrolase [Bifidobacteriaceae bacterium]